MKYIRNFKHYRSRILNEGWLSDKMNEWDNDIKDVMVKFVEPFKDIVKNIKEWQSINDPEKVKKDIQDVMDTSFTSLERSIDKVEKSETLIRLYDDIDQIIIQLNDVFNKELESLKESVESTSSGIKMVIGGLLDSFKEIFKEFKTEYLDKIIDKEEIDDKIKEAKDFFKKIYDKIKTEMKSVDVISLMKKGESLSNGDSGSNKTLDLKADDRIRYSKKNGEENIAIVANNQEDVESDELVKLRAEDGSETFTIDKSQIIEVLSGETSPEDEKNNVISKIEDIKNDSDKLKKVNDFIKKL